MNISEFQRLVYIDLFSNNLDKVFDRVIRERKLDYITVVPTNGKDFLNMSRSINDDLCATLKCDVSYSIEENVPGEMAVSGSHTLRKNLKRDNISLIKMPILTEDGIMFNGVRYGISSSLELADGWYFEEIKKKETAETVGVCAKLRRGAAILLEMKIDSSGRVTCRYEGGRAARRGGNSNKKDCSVYSLITAISGTLKFKDIYSMFEDFPAIQMEYNFAREFTEDRNTCCAEFIEGKDFNHDKAASENSIERFLRVIHSSLRVGSECTERLKHEMSFYDAVGKTLYKTVKLENLTLKKGTVLTAIMIKKLIAGNINSIYVEHEDTIIRLDKPIISDELSVGEICSVLKHLNNLYYGFGNFTDPDALYNKILKPINRIYESWIEKALNNLVAKINSLKEKFTAKEFKEDEFYHKELLASNIADEPTFQMLDNANSLSKFEQSFRITGTVGKNTSASRRDIKSTQFGRICPYTTSESKKVGVNLSLTSTATADEHGFLEMTVRKFENGKLGENVKLTALKDYYCVIAPYDVNLEEIYRQNPNTLIEGCRVNGEVVTRSISEVEYQDISSLQALGVCLSMVPAVERNAGKRLVMAVSAQRQAIPLITPQRPIVSTGFEAVCDIGVTRAKDIIRDKLYLESMYNAEIPENTQLILKDVISQNDYKKVIFNTISAGILDDMEIEHTIVCLSSGAKNSLRHMRIRPASKVDEYGNPVYDLNDIVFAENDVDFTPAITAKNEISFDADREPKTLEDFRQHAVAIGANCKIMFKSFEGFGYEDSIIINEDFVTKFGLAIITTHTKTIDLSYKSLGGKETEDFLNVDNVTGLPKIGTYFKTGQVIALTTNKPDPDDPVQDAPARTNREELDMTESGYVLSIRQLSNSIKIILGDISYLTPGDKVEGLHGNKGVIGRVVPYKDMPYLEDGTVPDMVLNPISVVARSNIGQEVEFALGAIAEKTGEVQILKPFDKVSINDIVKRSAELGIVEQVAYDGRSGRKFGKKAMVGSMYFLRLEHTSTSKFNALGAAHSYSTRTLQPKGGKGGGQRISELCTWAFHAYCAETVLDTLFTAQSDNPRAAKELVNCLTSGKLDKDVGYYSTNLNLLNTYLRILGFNVAVDEAGAIWIEPLTDQVIAHIKPKEVDVVYGEQDDAALDEALHKVSTFGKITKTADGYMRGREQYGAISLPCSMLMPLVNADNGFTDLIVCKIDDKRCFLTGDKIKGLCYTPYLDYNRQTRPKTLYYLSGFTTCRTNPDFANFLKTRYDIDLPETSEIPVLVPYNEREVIPIGSTGIFAMMRIYRRYNIDNSLCAYPLSRKLINQLSQPTLDLVKIKNLEKILNFRKYYSFDELLVHKVLVPPIAYREMRYNSRTCKKEPCSVIDSFLRSVLREVNDAGNYMSINLDMDELLLQDEITTDVIDESRLRDCISAIEKIYTRLNYMVNHNNNKRGLKTIVEELAKHDTKNAIMRDTLLAKRIQYSGRSVISINPRLKFGECGVPVKMLETIFEDALVSIIKNMPDDGGSLELKRISGRSEKTDRIRKLIQYVGYDNLEGFSIYWKEAEAESCNGESNCYHSYCKCRDELINILNDLLDKYPALLNREPSLHKFSIQGFKAVPVTTDSLQLHPLNCKGFNADYDGDQMLCAFPIHPAAIKEVKEKMFTTNNLINPSNGESIIAINQDIILGLYYASIHRNNSISLESKEIVSIYHATNHTGFIDGVGSYVYQIYQDIMAGVLDIHDIIMLVMDDKIYVSEAGRILLNSMIPDKAAFKRVPSITYPRTAAENKFDNKYQLDKTLKSYKQMLNICYDGYKVPDKGSVEYKFEEMYADKYYSKTVQALAFDCVWGKDTVNNVVEQVTEYYNMHADEVENNDSLAEFFERVKCIGFLFADLSGITLSLWDFGRLDFSSLTEDIIDQSVSSTQTIAEMYNAGFISEEERVYAKYKTWSDAKNTIRDRIVQEFKKDSKVLNRYDNIFMIVDSGARGKIDQLVEISGIIGPVQNASGERLETPITSSYMNGLNINDFYSNSYTVRKQIMTAQLSTAEAGSQTRNLIYVCDHIHTNDDDLCSASPTRILLDYDPYFDYPDATLAYITSEGSCKKIFNKDGTEENKESNIYAQLDNVLKDNDLSVLSDYLEDAAWSEKYIAFCRQHLPTEDIFKKPIKEIINVLEAAGIRFVVTESIAEDSRTLIPQILKYKMKRTPRSMIYFRTLDSGVTLQNANLTHRYTELSATSLDVEQLNDVLWPSANDENMYCCFVSNDTIEFMEKYHIAEAYIYTILNCESRHGICKRCFGVKYDTFKLPEADDYVGYQAVQSIGEPVSQLVLDSHKNGGSTNTVAEVFDACCKYSVSNIPEDHITPGEHCEDFKVDLWRRYVDGLGDTGVLARNFELLTRSQTEHGIALETKGDVLEGGRYTLDVLRDNNVLFRHCIISTEESIESSDKVLTSIAYEDLKKNLLTSSVLHKKNNRESYIGRILIGDIENSSRPLANTTPHHYAKTKVIYTAAKEEPDMQDIKNPDSNLVQNIDLAMKMETVPKNKPKTVQDVNNTSQGIIDNLVIDQGTKTSYFGG